MRRVVPALRIVLVAGLVAGPTACSSPPEDHGGSVPGRAREALDCPGRPWQQGAGAYETGLEAVQDDAEAAFDDWLDNEGALLPDIEVEETARAGRAVLFTWREGETRLGAFVVHDDMDDVEGHHGWGVASFAYCDPAFWPPERSDEEGYEIWSNADGDRVPTSLVYSMAGSEDCGGTDMTFLYVGKVGRDTVFYRRPGPGFADHVTVPYADHVALPPGATDTGYSRDGRALWVTDDAAYLVGPDGDAERWPAPSEQLGCG